MNETSLLSNAFPPADRHVTLVNLCFLFNYIPHYLLEHSKKHNNTKHKPVVAGKVGRTASVQFGSEVKNM